MEKEYIQAQCDKTQCSHWNDPCCQLCTEVVRQTDGPIHLMFIGMGAGKDEDINLNRRNTHRQPWVGRAGKYLRSIISHLWNDAGLTNLDKFNIALSNTVRCHPKDDRGKDRAPTSSEETMCRHILERDIQSVRPIILIPCGLSATQYITNMANDRTMGQAHGGIFDTSFGVQAIPTYHASFLTRTYGTFKPEEQNCFDTKVIADIVGAVTIAKAREYGSTLETTT